MIEANPFRRNTISLVLPLRAVSSRLLGDLPTKCPVIVQVANSSRSSGTQTCDLPFRDSQTGQSGYPNRTRCRTQEKFFRLVITPTKVVFVYG